jgi:predicted GIY-YIG superfamily endonuclease
MNYFIYVLINPGNKRFYVGLTTDIKRRLKEHQTAKLSHRNIDFKPVLIEIFSNKKDAQRRENYLKTTKGKFTLKAMLKETLR